MKKCHEKLAFMGCYIATENTEKRPDGLINLHVYSITKLCSLEVNHSTVQLIRLRNPCGGSAEWNGRWSDNDHDSWNSISREERDELWVTNADGEFWMDVTDFQKCFTFVEICHQNPCLFPQNAEPNWRFYMFEDMWFPFVTAGGGLTDKETFANNPQYSIITVEEGDNLCWIIIALMQKERRELKEKFLPLQLHLFHVPNDDGRLLDKAFFDSNSALEQIEERGVRQILMKVHLPAGNYCVIPNTGQKNIYGNYLLRIYSDKHGRIRENDTEIGYSAPDNVDTPDGQVTGQIWSKIFTKISLKGMKIGMEGVRKALNAQFGKKMSFKTAFSKETCKNIVALWDTNHSGKLDLHEFQNMMQHVYKLKQIFKKYDSNHSRKLNGFELRNILKDCGYQVNKKILIILMSIYGDKGSISFEKFVICVFKLKKIIDEFRRRQGHENEIILNLSDLMAISLHL
ncbi:calpain-A-like isoform X2 [Tribolium madens]|nr:calpain-A-like isoform X2 [Tribolium madens]